MINNSAIKTIPAALCVTLLAPLAAQEKTANSPVPQVPRLVRHTGSFRPGNGQPAQPIESATLSVYREQSGGDPLWRETQNITVDADGHYAVVLGATLNDGVPVELFASGEPRWLGVQFNRPGEPEQPRVQLLSVPYALRASDAETLGGRPASAYLLAPSATAVSTTPLDGAPPASNFVRPLKTAAAQTLPFASAGTPGFLGMFTNSTDLGNSVMFQSAGKIGLATTSPLDYLHVRFTDTSGGFTGYAVQNLGSTAASYSGMLFYDQNGALGQFQGFNNSTHEYRINNIASGGSINFMLGTSKFQVRSDGDIDIAGSVRKAGTLFLHNLGNQNTALGLGALGSGSGAYNTAMGQSALSGNQGGNYNNAVGAGALSANTTGYNNNALGWAALGKNTTGASNTAIGDSALYDNVSGFSNIAIGASAGSYTTGSSNIDIDNVGVAGENGVIRIGNGQTKTFIVGIRGATTGVNNAINVVIDSSGQLGTVSSSRRYKEDIHDMGDASAGLMRLRPVTYRYKQPYADGSKPLDYGLIAEEVAEVYPDLVARNRDGEIETVQYQKLTPMLLNEIQRQHTEAEKQQAEIEALKAELAGLKALWSSGLPTAATARQEVSR